MASSGLIPGSKRRSRIVGSLHETGCSAKKLIPGRWLEKGNCRITERVRGKISGAEKLGNHRFRYSGSGNGVPRYDGLQIAKRAYAERPISQKAALLIVDIRCLAALLGSWVAS